MPAYIGITAGGAVESGNSALLPVVSTVASTGKDVEIVLNNWPATSLTKVQILVALQNLQDFLLQQTVVP